MFTTLLLVYRYKSGYAACAGSHLVLACRLAVCCLPLAALPPYFLQLCRLLLAEFLLLQCRLLLADCRLAARSCSLTACHFPLAALFMLLAACRITTCEVLAALPVADIPFTGLPFATFRLPHYHFLLDALPPGLLLLVTLLFAACRLASCRLPLYVSRLAACCLRPIATCPASCRLAICLTQGQSCKQQ